jgi:hypothetical protein
MTAVAALALAIGNAQANLGMTYQQSAQHYGTDGMFNNTAGDAVGFHESTGIYRIQEGYRHRDGLCDCIIFSREDNADFTPQELNGLLEAQAGGWKRYDGNAANNPTWATVWNGIEYYAMLFYDTITYPDGSTRQALSLRVATKEALVARGYYVHRPAPNPRLSHRPAPNPRFSNHRRFRTMDYQPARNIA